jgi:hypothetical protein
MKQFENLTLQQGSHARMKFGILPRQQGNCRRVHAVWYPATESDCRALVCSFEKQNPKNPITKKSNVITV